jgi:hypothetical protein
VRRGGASGLLWITSVCAQLVPLVYLGIDEANPALMTDDQLADRFAAAELPAWENDEAFEQLLLSFESTLPLAALASGPTSAPVPVDPCPERPIPY